MDMIFADYATHNVNLKPFTGLTDKFSDTLGNVPFQYMISILGYPNEMVFDLKLCMTVSSIDHAQQYKATTGKMLPA